MMFPGRSWVLVKEKKKEKLRDFCKKKAGRGKLTSKTRHLHTASFSTERM
jgi:hypothetical protein